MSTPTTATRFTQGPMPQQALQAGSSPAPAVAPAAPRRIRSDELFEGQAVEIEIEHLQQVYRLRRTSLGKLILTK
jgi:hemin uptake protein HemP